MKKKPVTPISVEAKLIKQEFSYKQVAALYLLGCKQVTIARELNLTANQVGIITKSQEFLTYLKDEADQLANLGRDQWRSAVVHLIPKAVSVLKYHLKNNNLEAVKLVMKTIGSEKEVIQQSDSNITVILPSELGSPIVIPNEHVSLLEKK